MLNRKIDWDYSDELIIKRLFSSGEYRRGDSGLFTYQATKRFDKELIVINFNRSLNVFIVWNTMYHKDCFIGKTHTLSAVNCFEYIKAHPDICKNGIISFKKNLRKSRFKEETYFVVGKDALYEFCSNYMDYFLKADNALLENNSENETIIREYEETRRKKRDPYFRDLVLKKYNSTCIICGCKEPNILEAAHIKSVANGGSDDVSNGYCLCANHHRLFDSCKLTIDQKNGTFGCSNTSETNELWYKEAEKRNFKLILPEEE